MAAEAGGRIALLCGLAMFTVAALAGCVGEEEDAIAEGNRLWADSAYTEALAEYRLALSRNPSVEALSLVAHAYARTGNLERTRDAYSRLLEAAPGYRDQAVYDFLAMARRARERNDLHGMARSVETAVTLQAGAWPADLAGPLARYYAQSGEPARAIRFYELALVHVPPDSTRALLYDLGRLHEDQQQCRAAIGYFQAYAERWPDDDRADQARWQIGNCSFELAREARQDGRVTESLDHLETVIELGVPENVQDQAWFERGELLFSLGRDDEALEAYRRVLELNPARTGQIVDRAQRRIDQIRFGGPE